MPLEYGKKIFLVINPFAGQMHSRAGLFEMVRTFCDAGLEVTVHTTSGRNDARRQVAARGAGYDAIACCGGDGTLNEVISGMIDGDIHVPVGYIPAGSTNDFASSLSIPKSIKDAALNVVRGEPRTLDIGQFGDSEYFTYIASAGVFSRTSFETPQNVKNAVGHFAYILNGASELFDMKPRKVTVSTGGVNVEDEVLFVGVANTISIGGVIGLPKELVELSDGLFEILLIKPPKNAIELNNMIMKISKHDYNDQNLMLIQAESADITFDEDTAWTRDGENGGVHRTVALRNLRERISVILPDNS